MTSLMTEVFGGYVEAAAPKSRRDAYDQMHRLHRAIVGSETKREAVRVAGQLTRILDWLEQDDLNRGVAQ
ncbi:hypothetical protein [Deinococcus sp. PEB2-63]